ncbi:MAG TPA: hypothetical protein VK777_30480 [Reyranella sp.]|jgi:hypothetical protein|nr:hypothetical protein [Reyranella sp.]
MKTEKRETDADDARALSEAKLCWSQRRLGVAGHGNSEAAKGRAGVVPAAGGVAVTRASTATALAAGPAHHAVTLGMRFSR